MKKTKCECGSELSTRGGKVVCRNCDRKKEGEKPRTLKIAVLKEIATVTIKKSDNAHQYLDNYVNTVLVDDFSCKSEMEQDYRNQTIMAIEINEFGEHIKIAESYKFTCRGVGGNRKEIEI